MNTAISRRRLMQIALAPATLAGAQVADLPPTVSRVYPGADGKLVYVPDEQGNTIPDFSHAGYGGGGTPIPSVPVKETVWPVAGDNTANLQAAIDKVSALPLDKNGFRGAVLIKMGYYQMATPLKIQASGVVLAGRGHGRHRHYPDRHRESALWAPRVDPAGGQPTLVRIAGAAGWANQGRNQATCRRRLCAGRRPEFHGGIRAADFRPGDTVIVRRIGNQDWIDAMGMNGENPGKSLAAVQRRLGSRGGRRSGQHDHHRCAHHLRYRESNGAEAK